MAKDTRTRKLEAAFADPAQGETMIGGLRLRSFSLGTLNVCRQLDLSLFLDGEADLNDEEKQRQIVAFAWAQSAPLSEVLGALRTGTANDKIAEFEFRMDVAALPELITEIQRISDLAAAAAVEVAPKPGRSGEDDAPPNC
jgi:hypothetical protein